MCVEKRRYVRRLLRDAQFDYIRFLIFFAYFHYNLKQNTI